MALSLLLGRRQAAGGGGQCRWRFRGAKTEIWVGPKAAPLVFSET